MSSNSVDHERCGGEFESVVSEQMVRIKFMNIFLIICSGVNTIGYLWRQVSIGPGDGFVPDIYCRQGFARP